MKKNKQPILSVRLEIEYIVLLIYIHTCVCAGVPH